MLKPSRHPSIPPGRAATEQSLANARAMLYQCGFKSADEVARAVARVEDKERGVFGHKLNGGDE